jgi:hypothetical protein
LGLALLLSACEGDPANATRPEQPVEGPFSPGPLFIVNGFIDDDDTFDNVGAFIVQQPSDGQIFPICSGTLIAPGIFLTAAHCTEFFLDDLAPLGFTAHVSFSSPIGWGDLTDLGSIDLIEANQVITNPAFSHRQSDPGDLGVLILPAGTTAGITPATLPAAGLLDQLAAQKALRGAIFTAVGYGVQDRVVGGGPPFFQDLNPIPRMFAFSSFNALTAAWLRLSQNPAKGDGGTCFGDSGGPNFLTLNGEQILAAITVTGDTVCRATNVTYRLDTPSARSFLGQFVALP